MLLLLLLRLREGVEDGGQRAACSASCPAACANWKP